jgi:hypothetical protein
MNFIQKSDMLSPCQYGFRSKLSTTKAAIDLLSQVLKALENGLHVAATFCDLTKAFDCVTHCDLLNKIERYGLRGNTFNLNKTYLLDRKQVVVYNNNISRVQTLNIGVGQGSAIGPLLFLLFINDLPEAVNAGTVMYADDTTFINSGVDHCQVTQEINNNMDKAVSWFNENKLKLNENKTFHLVFSLNRILHDDNLYNIQHVKFLGFMLDSQLNWKDHVRYVASKINTYNFMLYKIKRYVSVNTAKTVYFSYIQSLIQYGIVLWGNSTNSIRIFRTQKNAIRILSGVTRRTSCRQLFKELGILTLPCIYIFQLLLYIKESGHLLTSGNDLHNYNTRAKSDLRLPKIRLASSQSHPSFIGVSLFNRLPLQVRELGLRKFKNCIYKLLLDKTYYSVQEYLNDSIIDYFI